MEPSHRWRQPSILDAEALPCDLIQACNLLTAWGMVGIVEQFALSAKVFQAKYEPHLHGFTFNNVRKNVTAVQQHSYETQLHMARDMLGESLYEDFMAANAHDSVLYAHGCALLQQSAELFDVDPLASQPGDTHASQ